MFIPEIEKEADWDFSRVTDDSSLGTVSATTSSVPLPSTVRKLVVTPFRDLQIQQDGSTISTFKVVNANQRIDPRDSDVRSRVAQVNRNIIFSRVLNDTEIGGTIIVDTISYLPLLSTTDTSLLDILDANPDVRQLFVLGVLKNQILSDIVQGGLTPAFTLKYASLLKECVAEHNVSADADLEDHEDMGFVRGVGF